MRRPFPALAVLAFAGCDDHIFPIVCGDAAPTWQGVQSFMSDNCSQCHGGPDGGAGFNIVLTPDDENNTIRYDMNDPNSSALAQYNHTPPWSGELVVPGDSENSVLWQAVNWSGPDGITPMPLGGSSPLICGTVVRDWIDSGAALDTAATLP